MELSGAVVAAVARRASINHSPEPLAGKVVSIIVAMISACLIATLFSQLFPQRARRTAVGLPPVVLTYERSNAMAVSQGLEDIALDHVA